MASTDLSSPRQDVRSAPEAVDLRFTEAEIEEEVERIVAFLREQIPTTIRRVGLEFDLHRAVVGISGGVDSALVAHLSVEALGAENVHGILMPNEVTDEAETSDAERVAENLGIEYDVVEIEGMIQAVLDGVQQTSTAGERRKQMEPLLADVASVRLRTLVQHLSRVDAGGMVVGTSNRSEWLTGHFDKYGDAAVDCQPILHLYKAQVYQLARHEGVADSILERPANPGFRAMGSDEENLGIEYETLDAVLALHVDGGLSAGRTAEVLDVDRELVEEVVQHYEDSWDLRAWPPAPQAPTERPETPEEF